MIQRSGEGLDSLDLDAIREKGAFTLSYHLMIRDRARKVTLKIVPFREDGVEKLLASVRAWRDRQ